MITGTTRVAAVIGWPVEHSRSPQMFEAAFAATGIDAVMIPIGVPHESLALVVGALRAMRALGASVTLPHKLAAAALCDELTGAARAIGAVNCLHIAGDRLVGHNTDCHGFTDSLAAAGLAPRGARCVLLGAGGAARAIVVSLLDAGVPEIRLVNRTTRRAEEIAEAVGGPIKVLPWEARADALTDAALLVNGTTLGMAGQQPLALELAKLPTSAVVYDIVYVPLLTELLKAAQARGNQTVDGIGMLLHQGRPGFKAWFGQDAQVTPELRAFVLGT